MIQAAMEAGQLPEPQVILPGDEVQIFIAHDVVRLGLAHHGDGLGVHPRTLGVTIGEGPGAPGKVSGQAQPPQQEEGEKSQDLGH
jgi:hypothetical protein